MMKLYNKDIRNILKNISTMFQEKMEELSKLDSLVGDGDHGVSMSRGAREALVAIQSCDDQTSIEELFQVYGNALIQGVGGAVGPLFGSIFYEFAKATGNKYYFDLMMYKTSIENATEMVMMLGNAKANDKTMVDAMIASKEAMTTFDSFLELTKEVKDGAYQGVLNTIEMQAKKGRSKYRKEQSIGFQDAGATSYYYLVNEFYNYMCEVSIYE
jgi:phosphoenolpyruvate---glycerone phosphotransferase subunit DhaL